MRKEGKFLCYSLLFLLLFVVLIIGWSLVLFRPFGSNDGEVLGYMAEISLVMCALTSLVFAVLSLRIKRTFLGVLLVLFDFILLGLYCVHLFI